jgi:hypothetical protein
MPRLFLLINIEDGTRLTRGGALSYTGGGGGGGGGGAGAPRGLPHRPRQRLGPPLADFDPSRCEGTRTITSRCIICWHPHHSHDTICSYSPLRLDPASHLHNRILSLYTRIVCMHCVHLPCIEVRVHTECCACIPNVRACHVRLAACVRACVQAPLCVSTRGSCSRTVRPTSVAR